MNGDICGESSHVRGEEWLIFLVFSDYLCYELQYCPIYRYNMIIDLFWESCLVGKDATLYVFQTFGTRRKSDAHPVVILLMSIKLNACVGHLL